MASSVITEAAIGTLDGVNVQFQTSGSYVPGTLFVFWNGQLQRQDFVTEVADRQFSVDEAPEAVDVLYVRYVSRV
jgi:hypothetical protein